MYDDKNNIQDLQKLIRAIYEFNDQNRRETNLKFQLAKNSFKCLEECMYFGDFIEKFTTLRGEDFNIYNSLGFLSEELLKLSILDSNYQIREEWVRFLFKANSENISQRIFKKLINLCNKINNIEENDLGSKCYNYFRMDTLIRKPILEINEFENGLAVCLLDKFPKYCDDFIKLFKEFYVKASNFNELKYDKNKVCSNCNYLFSESDEHIFCKDNKFIEKQLSDDLYILKIDVFRDYTKPGLIEKDAFDKLNKEGFEVELYPDIEKQGDLKIILENKNIYIDCKSSKNVDSLWNELRKEKYKDRIILVPDLYYSDMKEYIKVKSYEEFGDESKILNLDDLISYLKKQKRKYCNE